MAAVNYRIFKKSNTSFEARGAALELWLPFPEEDVESWLMAGNGFTQTDVLEFVIQFPVLWDFPTGRISSIVATVVPAGAHVDLPDTMPAVTLFTRDSDAVLTATETEIDPSASVVAYEAQHTITLSPAAAVFSSGNSYVVQFRGEASGDSLGGLRLEKLVVNVVPE